MANLKAPSAKNSFVSKDGRASVLQTDAIQLLSSLPENSVDVIITDPAYSGMNQMLKLGKGRIIGEYKNKGEQGKWFEEFHDTTENYTKFLSECARVLKKDRHIYIMFDSYSLLTLGPIVRDAFQLKNILTWDKINIGLGHYFRRRHEFIIFASKGKRKLSSKMIPDVWRVKRVMGRNYPTQKPVEIFELMLIGSADRDFLVCDPFLGSGSSAIAALKRGCRFIGSDISKKSFDVSTKRIEAFQKTGRDILQTKNNGTDDPTIERLLHHA